MTDRISKDAYFMGIALLVSQRSECRRRAVGAVIVDIQGRILSTGFNGKEPGAVSCFDKPCKGANAPSGESLNECLASHAEISALIYLPDPRVAHTIYVTTEPCITCTKALLLTGIEKVIHLEDYPSSGKSIWTRDWRKLA